MRPGLFSILIAAAGVIAPGTVRAESDWSIDIGARFFKHSAQGQPNELATEPVFDRWEGINQDRTAYSVSDYAPLEPLYFNMNFGVDVLVRYRTYLMIKLGYDYSNPFGIGGSGHIRYTDNASGVVYEEEKEFSYTSHQLNYFVGPIVPINQGKADIYLGFSPMAPTWVRYRENLSISEDGTEVRAFDRKYRGFFGSCRAVLGVQVRVHPRLKVGSELGFVFLNYMKLESGDLADHSFRFPAMKFNVTLRYSLR